MDTSLSFPARQVLQHVEETADLLKLISHPHRLTILCLLSEGEYNVTELVKTIGINQTAVSNHLSKLRNAGVVEYTRYHRVLQYRIVSPKIQALIDALSLLYPPQDTAFKQHY